MSTWVNDFIHLKSALTTEKATNQTMLSNAPSRNAFMISSPFH